MIHKYSDYIGFPIYLGDGKEPVNKQTSLWRTPRQEVTEEQYKDFYRQATLDYEEPLMHIHMLTDAPCRCMFFIHPAEIGAGNIHTAQGRRAEIVFPEYFDRRI